MIPVTLLYTSVVKPDIAFTATLQNNKLTNTSNQEFRSCLTAIVKLFPSQHLWRFSKKRESEIIEATNLSQKISTPQHS
jgi:hypothetical protein